MDVWDPGGGHATKLYQQLPQMRRKSAQLAAYIFDVLALTVTLADFLLDEEDPATQPATAGSGSLY